MAGPVRPELLLEGAARVEVMLEESERYVLVSRFKEDEEGQEQRRYSIVDWKSRTHCELPENIARIERSMLGPSGRRKEKPLFLLPLVLQEPGEGEEPGPQVLSFYDESCELHGEAEYGPISSARNTLALDSDGREVLIYGNGKGLLALADPWRDERSEITTGFSAFSFVQRPGSLNSPQLLWVIENGHLTQRGLDGTLMLSLGERVNSFAQGLLTQLRVAYLEERDLFEAVGPDFEPTRIAQDVCSIAYRGTFLELQQSRVDCAESDDPKCDPCSERQLVRNNLMTGETVTFDPGVFEAYSDSGFAFELQSYRDGEGATRVRQWLTLPGDKMEQKFALEHPYEGRPLVLDTSHLVGIKNKSDEDGSLRRALVVTSLERVGDKVLQPELDIFAGEAGSVESFFMIPDYRTSSFWWLVFHNRMAEGEAARGSLSLVSALDRVIQRVADDVPVSALPNAPSVRGYSVEVLPTFTKERAIAYIDEAVPLDHDPRGMSGTLHVRLMSGALGATIARDVTSYHLLSAPLPGVLYGVEHGEQQGLWFAAL